MRTFLSAFRAAAAVALVAGSAMLVFAQSDEQRLAEAKAQTVSYLRYFKFESKFSAKEADRLAELRVKIHSPATSLEDRKAALKEFAMMLFRAAGTIQMPPELEFVHFHGEKGPCIERIANQCAAY